MRAIHSSDPDVPVLANAMGQSYVDPVKFPTCTKFFKGVSKVTAAAAAAAAASL